MALTDPCLLLALDVELIGLAPVLHFLCKPVVLDTLLLQ
jgi:hypothetical protein